MAGPFDARVGDYGESRPMPRFPHLETTSFDARIPRRIDFWPQTSNAWMGNTRFDLTPEQLELQARAKEFIALAGGAYTMMHDPNLASAAFTAIANSLAKEATTSVFAFDRFVQAAQADTTTADGSAVSLVYHLAEEAFRQAQEYISQTPDLESAISRQGGSLERVTIDYEGNRYVVYRNYQVEINQEDQGKSITFTDGSSYPLPFMAFEIDAEGKPIRVLSEYEDLAKTIAVLKPTQILGSLVDQVKVENATETRPFPDGRERHPRYERGHDLSPEETQRMVSALFTPTHLEGELRMGLREIVSCLVVMDTLGSDREIGFNLAAFYGQQTWNEIQRLLEADGIGVTVYKAAGNGYVNIFTDKPLTDEEFLTYAQTEGNPNYLLRIDPQEQINHIDRRRLEQVRKWLRYQEESSVYSLWVDAGIAQVQGETGRRTIIQTTIFPQGEVSSRRIDGGVSVEAGIAINQMFDQLNSGIASRPHPIRDGSDTFVLGIKV